MSARQQHPATLDVADLLADCEIRRQRRSGPGGQHRNKVETAIFIEHKPTGVTAEASERRSQETNRQRAIFRLRMNLAAEVRSKSIEANPSELWQSRCKSGKMSVNPQHEDFPALLAEALDHIGAHAWDVKAAAQCLGCSTSQLVRLLAMEPRALATVNDERQSRNLNRLK